jgi:3-hydroxyisobutyrate dehydrogenase
MKMELFLKDIRLMLEAGQDLHVPLPLTGMMQQLYTAACAGGHAKQDLSGIVRLYEAMAGLGCRDAGDTAGSKEHGGNHG